MNIDTKKLSITLKEPKREQWIDIARVTTAILVIYGHLNLIDQEYQKIALYSREIFFNGRIPFFMLLAGYFCGFNISKKHG